MENEKNQEAKEFQTVEATAAVESNVETTDAAVVNAETATKDEKVVEQKPEKAVQEVPEELKNVIEAGRKGDSNKQMTNPMKKAIDEDNVEVLKLLQKHYPAVFESSKTYIGHTRREKLSQII